MYLFPFTPWILLLGLNALLLLTIGPIFLEFGTVLWFLARRIRDDTVVLTIYVSQITRVAGLLLLILGFLLFTAGYDSSAGNPYLA
jgi:hypothetical protein